MGSPHNNAFSVGVLLSLSLAVLFTSSCVHCQEYPTYGGFKNNKNEPTWGMAGGRFLRGSDAAYTDGAYQMAGKDRPNPMEISVAAHSSESLEASSYSRNALLAFFGQLILDEVGVASNPGCPPEYENMEVPRSHPISNSTERPQVFVRSVYDQRTGYTSEGPRRQTNQVSSYMDGEVIYGTSRVWTNHLRSFRDGKLLADVEDVRESFPVYNDVKLPFLNSPVPFEHTTKPVSRLFRIGNAKGHENPFLLALQVIWLRWHNKVAEDVATSDSSLSDQQIFDITRSRVIAHFQNIALKEWLPAFVYAKDNNQSNFPGYLGYNKRVEPDVTHEFLAAMTFRHTFTPGAVWTLGYSVGQCTRNVTQGRGPEGQARDVPSLRLCNNFWDPQNVVKVNFENIVRGMIYTLGTKEDGTFESDFIESFHGPYEYSRTDHVAEQIQRFRDHGLADYNSVRKAYKLATRTDWSTLGGSNGTISDLYGGSGGLDNLDFVTGGLLDAPSTSGMSDIFKLVIEEQFTRLRDGDRFWYQNEDNGLFNASDVQDIESVTFRDILLSTTSLTDAELPPNVFLCEGTGTTGCPCKDPPDVSDSSSPDVDVCTPLRTYDYIKGSEWSFALSFLALAMVAPVSYLVLCLLVRKRKTTKKSGAKQASTVYSSNNPSSFQAREWLGKTSGYRDVLGELVSSKEQIVIRDGRKKILRVVEFKRDPEKVHVMLSNDKDLSSAAVVVPGDIDLILKFPDFVSRNRFHLTLEKFVTDMNMAPEMNYVTESFLHSKARDKDQRQGVLDIFFRAICERALEGETSSDTLMSNDLVEQVIHIKLNMAEFADALGMQPSSLFVRNVFLLGDKNKDGYVSFEEFLDLFAVFLKGTAEEKARLLFNTYDIKKRGYLTKDEIRRMLKSIVELSESTDVSETSVDDLVTSMLRHQGLQDNDRMTFEHFRQVFCAEEFKSTLEQSTLSGEAVKHAPKIRPGIARNKRNTMIMSYIKRPNNASRPPSGENKTATLEKTTTSPFRSSLRVSVNRPTYPGSKAGKRWYELTRYINRYSRQIFWVTLYTLITIGIFVERAYFYAKGREHAGLRRLSGAWVVAMIRGSASVIMFTYVSLLVTMCRNTITALRETFLHRFIPFDSAVAFHKYIAVLAMIGTLVHIVGHAINLYCMCTQTTASVNCFFREYFTASDSFAPFHYWAFQTITGLAGVFVTILIFVMYVFATQFSRRHVFKAFWMTHSMYWLVYVLTFLHGIGRLVQSPLFPWYAVGPVLLFIVDRLMSISRNKAEIAVTSATALPSDVLRLVFKRPSSFTYRSGQWVRIACLGLSDSEYHPFTLTSAPHEPLLSLHIRAVGPWTRNLRKIYGGVSEGEALNVPNLYLDGPFGEGHQDWYTCDVAVLVGGGIGVTPFASILKDIAFKSKSGVPITCKKVYFIWVTRTQRSYEWLVDIIRDVEKMDTQGLVHSHIFVTQFRQKFDLRTTMLYICERFFQKLEGQSLFTGLKAVTHFGRPQFEDFFCSLVTEHKQVSQVGVFSCGPGPMTASVQKACTYMNGLIGPTFTHHYENF
ncbi:dual oxidase 2 [Aplysia californica]|uniref:NAD(P)H oxidase (H2O2-forming) n=1 Tax=Aplysia californica TaxID=6500 RepID=A0ABM1A9N5_APLCA|nr:dual oxidase 2 [Aplysia californica]